MINKIIFSSVFLIILNFAIAVDFPEKYRKCKAGDTECIKNVINSIIADNYKLGIPEINLVPFDPLPFQNLIINTGGAAYHLDILGHEGVFYGLSGLHLDRVEGFGKDPRNTVFKYFGKAPLANFKGNFTGNGQLVILPISGKGVMTLNMTDMVANGEFKTKVVRKNGEDYLKIKSGTTGGDAEKSIFYFENLFSNKEIEKEVNNVINQNSRAFLNDLRPSLMKAYSILMVKLLQPVFDVVPYRKFFLED